MLCKYNNPINSDKMDSNNDKFITMDELMAAVDKNKDGVVGIFVCTHPTDEADLLFATGLIGRVFKSC